MRQWMLLTASVVTALGLSLLLLRSLAPQLLGLPRDLQLVRSSETLPPFYEGVFRDMGSSSEGFLINDPLTVVRLRPLRPASEGHGPHDLLGFRNHDVPRVADVVAIGDSQTYGNNAALEESWPGRLQDALDPRGARVYSMASGAWGAVQYLYVFEKALAFEPRVVAVAFYSGNDPLESFRLAYADERWARLRPEPDLTPDDLPPTAFPPPRRDRWTVDFGDGERATFAPKLRLASNADQPAARAGWGVMARVATEIAQRARASGVAVIFTILPTKELVYAARIARDGIEAPDDYRALVSAERENIAAFAAHLGGLEGAEYVDLVEALERAALEGAPVYPEGFDGHPLPAGYSLVARRIAAPAGRILNRAGGREWRSSTR